MHLKDVKTLINLENMTKMDNLFVLPFSFPFIFKIWNFFIAVDILVHTISIKISFSFGVLIGYSFII